MSRIDNIGEYLKSLRGDKSLGQVEAITGITKSYLSRVERGERGIPSPKVLEKLAKAYNVDYDELLDNVGYTESDPELFLIRRAAKQMNSEQKEKMMNIFKQSFKEFFPD